MNSKKFEYLKHLNRQRNIKTKIIKQKIGMTYFEYKKKNTPLIPEKYKNVTFLMTDLGIGDAIVMSFLIYTLR